MAGWESRVDSAAAKVTGGYNPNEPRDESGKWTTGGASSHRPFETIIDDVHAIEEKARAETAAAYSEAHAMMKTHGVEAAEAHYAKAITREKEIRDGPQIKKLMEEAVASKTAEKAAKDARAREIQQAANERERAAHAEKRARDDESRKIMAKRAAAAAKRTAKRNAR